MTDQQKSKTELISELTALRARLQRREPNAAGSGCDDAADTTTGGLCRSLFEKAVEGIMIVDPTTCFVVQVNPALGQMFGYPDDRMKGMPVLELHPERIRPNVASWFESHMQDFGVETLELECLAADGSEFIADLRVSLIEMAGRPYVVTFFADITRRRRAEELARVQRDLAQTLNATNDLDTALKACLTTVIAASNMDSGGIYLVDGVTGDIDLVCSEGLAPEFVQHVAHIDAGSPRACVVAVGEPLYLAYIQLSNSIGTPVIPEGLKASAVVPVRHDGRVIACLNLASHSLDEIPELARTSIEAIAASIGSAIVRLRAEQAVRESEIRFRELTDHINDAFWIVSPSWSEVFYVSPAYERIWGRSCESLCQSPLSWFKAIHEDDRDWVRARITETKHGNWSHSQNVEYRIIRPDGTSRWIRARTFPVRDDSGLVVRIIGVASDITGQRLAEKQLKASEARYREIFDTMQEGIAIIDENEVTVFANPAYASIFDEAGVEAVLGRSLVDYFPASRQAEAIRAAIRRPADSCETGQTSRHELQIVTRANNRKTILLLTTPRFDEKHTFIGTIGLVVDITQVKQAEMAIVHSEARYRELTDLLPQIVFELDADGYITYTNRYGFESLGLAQQSIDAGLHVLAVVAPVDRDEAMVHFRSVLSGEKSTGYEHRLVRHDGSEFPALVYGCPVIRDGKTVGARGVILDITERMRAETALRDSEERWHFALEGSGDGVWDWNALTDRVVFSRQWKAMLGYDESDIGNALDEWSSRVHPDDLEAVYAEIKKHFDGETPAYMSEHRLRCKDGSYKWILDRGKVVSWAHDGKPQRVISTHTDISNRKRAEDELAHTKAFLSVAIEQSQAGVLIADAPDGKISLANAAALGIRGATNQPLTEIPTELHPSNWQVYRPDGTMFRSEELPLSRAILEGVTSRNVEAVIRRSDGSERFILANASPVRSKDGVITAGIVVFADITELKQAESALREREARLSGIMLSAPIGIGIISNRILQHVNKTFCDMVGYIENELTNHSVAMLYETGEEFDRIGREYGSMATHGISVTETVWRRKDGSTIEVLLSVTPLDRSDWSKGITFTALDITQRKMVERALRERESRLSSVLKVAPIGIGLVADRVLLHVNQTLCEMIGYSEEEILNQNARMLYPTYDEYKFVGREKYDQIRKHGSGTVQTTWKKKDGSIIDVLLSSTPLDRSDWSKGITFTALDITERKRAERDLRAAEEQYRVLFERAGEGIMVASGEFFLLANPAFCALSGYSMDELTSVRINDFIHPEHREMEMDRYRRRQIGEPVPTGYDFKVLTKGGETKWVRINSTIISWQGRRASLNFVEDVTVSRAAQEEIRKFKTISDSATYGTVITDLDGTLLYLNEAFARMHDYRPDELLGQNLAVLHSDEQQKIVRSMNEGLIQTGSFMSAEVWHRRRDGTVFPTLMNGVVIKDQAGEPQFLAATAADITELKRLQEFADRARRLEAAGRIAGQVAHDFNNLLGPLVAYPEFIKEEIGLNHPANAYLDTMESAAQQMADINQQLLSLGRRGHYNLETLNVNEVIRQGLKQLQLQTERLEVVTELAGDLMNIKAGAAQVMRVVINLLSNAVDAMQGVGTLRIASQNWYAENPRGTYGQIERGEYVKVTVADTGCGIPEKILGQVFEPFFTTKKAGKKRGSGLGLSVVHAIMDDHGGYVDIESAEGRGTSIFLYFPITRDEQTMANDNQIVGGSDYIMLVDDDQVQQEVTTKLLRRLGYRVVAAGSGEDAVEAIQHESFDLILLDMVMPGGMDGVDTYRSILKYCPHQKAIIVSGFAEGDRVAEARQLGAGEFLKKPLTLNSLAQAVRRELDRVPDLQPV